MVAAASTKFGPFFASAAALGDDQPRGLMDEPTALLPPVSTRPLSDILDEGPLPLTRGLELLGVIAGQVARMHANGRTHGLLTPSVIRVQTYESGPPVVIFIETEATRDMSEGSDLYALGVLAFQVLGGRVPKVGETISSVVDDATPALEKLVAKLMAAKPGERLPASGAQRQFHDLAGTSADPRAKAAAPLGALPQIKRGMPIGIQKTDSHAWVNPKDKPRPAEKNPFADDEATATVANPRASAPEPEPLPELTPPPPPPPPRVLAGPAMEDEPTQFEPIKRPKRTRAPERTNTPLPPPVATPTPRPSMAVAEPTAEAFEPSRSDLPGNTGEPMVDPRLAPRRKKRSAGEHSPMSELMHVAKKQPPWMWGAIGVVLAFVVLLLIALIR